MKTEYTNLAIFVLFIFTLTSGDLFFKKINLKFSFLAKFQQQEKKKGWTAGSVDLATGKEKSNRRRQGLKERVQNLTSLRTEFTRPE